MYLVPFLFLGPNVFAKTVTLGVVMQVIDAFSQVHSSFSLFIYNWTTVTELRSIRQRLREFEANLEKHSPRPRRRAHQALPEVKAFVLGKNTSGGSDISTRGIAGALEP
jgi:ABC-type uncharacterized transport system fused permease/ATPase subunit